MRISDWSSDVCSSDLEFPTIVFLQSGWNVYTLQQAARRSWRIGQKLAVKVIYLGYAASSQMACLALMAKKILVSQSTSGDVPESGLDVLNQDGDSVEVRTEEQTSELQPLMRLSYAVFCLKKKRPNVTNFL